MATFSNLSTIDNLSNSLPISDSNPTTKKYWCHLCQKEFEKQYIPNKDVTCCFCNKTFCEQLETEDITNLSHPSNFHPFILSPPSPPPTGRVTTNYLQRRRHRIVEHIGSSRGSMGGIRRQRYNRNLLDFIMNFAMIQNYNDDFDNIINQIMINDTNKYGNPPAAKNAIEKLEKIKISKEKLKELGIENSCAVCKEEFIIDEECLLMPCKHHFHGECLLPWLKERNSCPVCRYELPTDDEDFEERKKQKLNRAINNNNSNIRNNSSSTINTINSNIINLNENQSQATDHDLIITTTNNSPTLSSNNNNNH